MDTKNTRATSNKVRMDATASYHTGQFMDWQFNVAAVERALRDDAVNIVLVGAAMQVAGERALLRGHTQYRTHTNLKSPLYGARERPRH